ncbi:sugar ABC transporter substrate-binding protein [Priestia koreensis]|uniref:Sugar ABC transporter substrate-binding protein n=2 Tax=Priestia koreensis TaxID=284581 RepID=A0A0M0KRA1_9BACI|nr:sugar ABC transporter substrate-binding protein [Priestia koreensis]
MKKMFSVLSLLLALTLVLAACGGSSEKTSGNKKELTAWAWNINVPVLKKAAEQFEKDNPGFKLKVVEMGREDVYSKLTTGLQAGGKGLPDIVLVEDDRVQGYVNAFPKAFLDISKMGFDKQADKFPEYKKALLEKDGKVYGFPFDGGPTGVFYRTDYFEKAGVKADDIKTWNDFIEAGKKIKEKVGVDFIGLDLNGDDGLLRAMLNQQGSFLFDNDGKVALNTEEAKKALQVQKDLKDAKLVKNTVGWDAWISAMSEGKTAVAPSGAWLAGSITQQAADTKGKWGVMQFPAFEEGGNRAANQGGSNYMILSSTVNKDLSYKFLEYFSTTDNIQLEAMKGGLFPTLNTIYNNEMFTGPDEFFSGQTIWKTFADEVNDIPPANYTENYSLAHDEAIKAQSEVMNGKSMDKALKDAEDRLKNRMNK